MMVAKLFIDLMRSTTSSSSSLDTKSNLFRMMRSANATWCSASLMFPSGLTSSRWMWMCFASTKHTTLSMR